MKAVMISIQPKWVEKIVNGEKTIEVRKSRPQLETPFKCYIYCTDKKASDNSWQFKPNLYLDNTKKVRWIDVAFERIFGCEFLQQKVIGEFICDEIIEFWSDKGFYFPTGKLKFDTCLTNTEFYEYGKGKPLYGWNISNLKIYDKPKELSEFKRWNRTEKNAPCAHTKWLYPPCNECNSCNLTRPPQSWCYVEI